VTAVSAAPSLEEVAPSVLLLRETCNVYALCRDGEAVLIDFGSGDILDALPAAGVDRVAAVLVTHHHRDQVQGIQRAVAARIPVFVPPAEQELFADADLHWAGRPLANSYDTRQDRFGPLEPVPLAGTLADYSTFSAAGRDLVVLPTPGHTPGSISLLHGEIAFTGDLLAGPGKVWSLAATQWSYSGGEGLAASVASLLHLRDRAPALLLPSHGAPMDDPVAAVDATVDRLQSLLALRLENRRLLELRARPYEAITPHLLRNRTSVANSYVLLAEDGHALLLDFGYDFATGFATATERAARRPWAYTLDALRRDFGVKAVDAVLLTHYHDDHVAGCEVLRRVEGAEVWAADLFAPVLRDPAAHDLPCLWHDPVPVDRELPLDVPVQWRGHTLRLHAQPGHTRYAVAVEFEVDGRRVLAVGDQWGGHDAAEPNYVYAGGFRSGDYRTSAELYRRLRPDIVLTGHTEPLFPTDAWFDDIVPPAAELDELHRLLLPLEEVDLEASGPALELVPYRVLAAPGATFEVRAEARNPLPWPAELEVSLVLPAGWSAEPLRAAAVVEPGERAAFDFRVAVPAGAAGKRIPIAADLVAGGRALGQLAEAVVRLG
jgi:glyoxylase-like metal-dependent hydrolase (beta-lactamase superfamily II)